MAAVCILKMLKLYILNVRIIIIVFLKLLGQLIEFCTSIPITNHNLIISMKLSGRKMHKMLKALMLNFFFNLGRNFIQIIRIAHT